MAANGRRQNPRQQVEAGTARRQAKGTRGAYDARRQRRPIIRKEACGFEDFEAFNLWASIVVDRRGGSNQLSARPTGSKWNRALPGPYPFKRGPVGAS